MLVSISHIANLLGVCTKTLRRWDACGVFMPACRTIGGHRRYLLESIEDFTEHLSRKLKHRTRTSYSPDIHAFQRAVVYGMGSAAKQKEDLKRQLSFLTAAVEAAGYQDVLIYKDIASELNDKRTGLT